MLNILYQLLLQLPPGTRNPDDNIPIDLSNPFDVIVYIILPLLVFSTNNEGDLILDSRNPAAFAPLKTF